MQEINCISEHVQRADLIDMAWPCLKGAHILYFIPCFGSCAHCSEVLLMHCEKPLCSAVMELKHFKKMSSQVVKNTAPFSLPN